MKTLLITLIVLFFSIDGINQPSSVTHELNVIDQPYEWACGEDYLDWDECYGNLGHDCPASGSYYVDFLTVLPGNKLTSLEINVSEFNCFETKYITDSLGNNIDTLYWARSTFSPLIWNFASSPPPNDLGWMSGIDIIDLATNTSVLYVRRDVLANIFLNGIIIIDDLNIPSGDYEVRLVRDEGDNLGANCLTGSGNIWINGFPGVSADFHFFGMSEVFERISLGLYNMDLGNFYEGPEIVATSITYNFEFTEFEWNAQIFHHCDSTGFSITAPHNPELTYSWLYNGLPASGANGSTLTPPPGVSSASGVHNYTVSASSPTGDILMQNSFVLNMHQNPYWDYSIASDVIYGAQEACPLMFEVEINADDAQLLNSVYTWESDTAFLELNFMDFGINGASANFCFDPFIPGDTIAVFYVEGTNNYGISGFDGCTTLDSAYVLYNDADSTIDIKSLPPPGNPTNISEFIAPTRTMNVYPNPTNHFLNINHSFDKPVNVMIFDVSGRLVTQYHFAREVIQMDVSMLSNGLYVLVMDDGEQRISTRVSKQ